MPTIISSKYGSNGVRMMSTITLNIIVSLPSYETGNIKRAMPMSEGIRNFKNKVNLLYFLLNSKIISSNDCRIIYANTKIETCEWPLSGFKKHIDSVGYLFVVNASLMANPRKIVPAVLFRMVCARLEFRRKSPSVPAR